MLNPYWGGSNPSGQHHPNTLLDWSRSYLHLHLHPEAETKEATTGYELVVMRERKPQSEAAGVIKLPHGFFRRWGGEIFWDWRPFCVGYRELQRAVLRWTWGTLTDECLPLKWSPCLVGISYKHWKLIYKRKIGPSRSLVYTHTSIYCEQWKTNSCFLSHIHATSTCFDDFFLSCMQCKFTF